MSEAVRLVLAGGGHSHVEVLRQLALVRVPNLSVTLITREALMPYSGMLPGCIAGHYRYDECHIDLRGLAQMAEARFCLAEVDGIDLERKLVRCGDRPPIPFDLLSLNTGARPAVDAVAGARAFAWPVKPVDAFIRRWQAMQADLAARPRVHRFVTVGGGAGGVELTLSMQHALRRAAPDAEFAIVSASPEILPTHHAGVRRRLERVLSARGVGVHRNESAVEVTAGEVRCASGLRIPFDTLIWSTQAAAAPWLRASGLAVDDDGFVRVNEALQSMSHDFVFAAGDVASFAKGPLPKSGVYAVREAPVLTRNLIRRASNAPLAPYSPQKHHLALISTGDRYAIASRGAWSAGGAWAWRWKNRIDRRWMNSYKYIVPSFSKVAAGLVTGRLSVGEAIPVSEAHTEPELPAVGAGTAVDQRIVQNVLRRSGLASSANNTDGTETPADKRVVQAAHVFPPFIDDLYLAGRIAAIHCLSELHAVNAMPHSAIALASVPPGEPRYTEETLADLLTGAQGIFAAENTPLTGVHAVQGNDLLFGLSMNGLRGTNNGDRAPQPDEVLVLTKPLGIGAIFAADLDGTAQNDWIGEALAMATQANDAAARILREHGGTCASVSSAGLAGAALQMVEDTACGVALTLERIPAISGALQVRGTRSNLQEQIEGHVSVSPEGKRSAAYPLLFDSETAGGFVALVPPAQAEPCLAALRAAGYTSAAAIGRACEYQAGTPRLAIA